MDIRDIINSINALTEENTSEEILSDVPAEEPEVAPEVTPEFNDGMSLADTFDTKAKIARALDNLKVAVDEFKDATAEKIDLLKDELLLGGIEKLGDVIQEIELALASGSNLLGDSELNDPFKAELPQEEETVNVPDEEEEEGTPAEEETEDEEDYEDYDFDSEAGLDLLSNNEE